MGTIGLGERRASGRIARAGASLEIVVRSFIHRMRLASGFVAQAEACGSERSSERNNEICSEDPRLSACRRERLRGPERLR